MSRVLALVLVAAACSPGTPAPSNFSAPYDSVPGDTLLAYIASELQFRAAECQDKLGNVKAAQAAYQRVVDLYPNTEWARRSQEKLTAAAASNQ